MHAEATKKDVEIRLSSIGHTLRRIAGVQLDGSVSMPYRLLSPVRRYSPARGCPGEFHESRSLSTENLLLDVDPELIRKGVRTLMHQVAQIERERVSIKFVRKLCRIENDDMQIFRTTSKRNCAQRRSRFTKRAK
jgi:rootletin